VVVFGLGPRQLLRHVMRPILRKLADLGIWNIMYVDDGWVIASSKSKADEDYGITLDLFKKAGFTIAEEKSNLIGDAATRKEYLGFLIDTEAMTVKVPVPKMSRIRQLLKVFLTSNSYKLREIASIVGKLNALELALGKSVFVGTRLATIAVVVATEVTDNAKRRNNPWEQKLTLHIETLDALQEVGDRMDDWNGRLEWSSDQSASYGYNSFFHPSSGGHGLSQQEDSCAEVT
jgi:hypothetical protein